MKKFLKKISTLVLREFIIEFRNKNFLAGLGVYLLSLLLIIYFLLEYNNYPSNRLPAAIWTAFFWLNIIFISINAVTNNFFRENDSRFFYYYYILQPTYFIFAKILFNSIVIVLLSLFTLLFTSIFLGVGVSNLLLFIMAIIVGSIAYSTLLTFMGAIAYRSGGGSGLLAVISLPLLIPILILIARITSESINTVLISGISIRYLVMIAMYTLVEITLSVVLFPYNWRD
jgi:heme exporter protein B